MRPGLRLKIWHKLFITLLLVVALILVLTAVLSQRSFTQGFEDYLQAVELQRITRLQSALVEDYSERGSWDFLRYNPRRWHRLMVQSDLAPAPLRAPPSQRRPRPDHQARPRSDYPERPSKPASPIPSGRVALLDPQQTVVIGPTTRAKKSTLYPIILNEQTIGYLSVERLQKLHHVLDRQFAKQQVQAFYLIALLALMVAVGAAWLLARQLSRPITQLTQTARKLTSGDYQARIERAGGDELGELARDFNLLATTLEKNRTARNQWVADISHELRTPLTILRGELDALEEGIRPLTQEALASLSLEVKQLQHLVNDLYQLSLTDLGALTYRKEPLDPMALLEETAVLFQNQYADKGITLSLAREDSAEQVQVLADPQRLAQLFTNLLENSLRYTDAGGQLSVRCVQGQDWVIYFEDSAPGLSAEQLPKIFDRLYRADSSRSREYGGSGLGLSIASSIVEAHGGTIKAGHSHLGGLSIEVSFPLLVV